ncbi:PAAR domain-containing protein [Paraburkholderia sp. CNPSo 3272]|uniref:PAAR domain-containing protein n=1 Tax=Paraburkholderia sp. CNPSo 3272 TaxID=2940931 RepID=UPI0020B84CBF|nr:PAAR domain-containing protein [Paraburkholderia sp. CNPSo 3272]MCP3722760.1 PAAR domain-containing protein [Paraburkholderia sp. CNPSo 3272]
MSDQQERKGTKYEFATVGARTERGGCVTSGSGIRIGGLPLACVDDIVTYSDGSEAVIADGAGNASVICGKPAALVGSRLSNGDRIISTVWTGRGIFVEEGKAIEGLFDPEWVPAPREPSARFAVAGATTKRGGVLKQATGTYEVRDVQQRAGRIGDFIEYADGTRARIITGIGVPGKPDYAFAVVGSLLDNGDVINDSPHRDVRTPNIFVPLNEHGVELSRQ